MTVRTFLLLHFAGIALGAAVLWWFVFPASPGEALADAITAGAAAGSVELTAARLGWWG
jgi:hypothetical protein